MTGVLYFHGFASSPKSRKVELLRELLAGIELNTPDMNVPAFERLDFEAMMRLAESEARNTRPDAIVGSSLGALVALELVRRGADAPIVLIAPALGIGERWKTTIPAGDPIEVFNHARNGQVLIHRAFFEQMSGVHPEANAPRSRVTILMGRKDESVPFALVRGVWDEWETSGQLVTGSRFIDIAGGDHGLVAWADVIAREIRDAARSER